LVNGWMGIKYVVGFGRKNGSRNHTIRDCESTYYKNFSKNRRTFYLFSATLVERHSETLLLILVLLQQVLGIEHHLVITFFG
jgi:hypothetical protein